ncbi:DUF58 domain-containing protein [Aliidiomarina sanyensis]|uniref:DUF58 domain-containing protein n=1 Tax=Aliidiomarina sanyensis TaxID=1249555 RepID=A0A432WDN3_9GAMM|nr:DUF58 domain-containing protein [Aliidiomarina sanyensis]RUO30525.1 DUF58 domain-containing protein [Aliidiomarina sanyensis]
MRQRQIPSAANSSELSLAVLRSNGAEPSMPELLRYRGRPLPLPIPIRQGSVMQSGHKVSRFRGRGMEFDEVRHYQPGDDIRAIDWRVTARTGKTHTKLFREETERPLFLCVDYGQSMVFGSQFLYKSVQAAHIAAGITWYGVQRGDRVGGLIFNAGGHYELKPQGRQHGALMLLKQLVAMHPPTPQHFSEHQPRDSFVTQLQRLHRLCRPGADVVIISDFSELSEESIDLLRGLKRHHAVTAILVEDPMELALPSDKRGHVRLYDGTKPHSVELANPHYAQAWQKRAEQWRAERIQQLHRASLQAHSISAAYPVADQWHEVRR